MWDGYYMRFDHVAQDTYPFWTRPVNQRWPVVLHDASTTASLIVNLSHLLDRIVEVWFIAVCRFAPHLSVENQSHDRRRRFPSTIWRIGLDGIQLLLYHRTYINT
jgi:hypothetical protein